ncbi:MAG: molybdopterin converting factor subunit 1 [Chakrabartia sp.]
MAVHILYFARVREQIGLADEMVDLPPEVRTLADLADFLARRSPSHQEAFADRRHLRAALDQQMADFDTPLGAAREIAFFPPVTGG